VKEPLVSSFQSWLQRLRDRQIDSAQLIQEIQASQWLNNSLLLGAGLGLALGLLIGWGIWPVQWKEASLGDLRTEAKADYLSAVSDAYVMYSSPEAAAIAQQRLSALGSTDLAKDFTAAITYYTASNATDKAIRISNLSRLASALGLTAPLVANGSQATPLNVLIQPDATLQPVAKLANNSASSNTNTVVSPSKATGASWLNWLLGLLTAMMLIVGVFYLYLIIRPLRARHQAATFGEALDDATIDARFNEMDPSTVSRRAQMYGVPETRPPSTSTYTSPAETNSGTKSETNWRNPAPTTPVRRTPRDDYEFDDEPEDEGTALRSTAAQHFATGPTLDEPISHVQLWQEEQASAEDEDNAADELDLVDQDEADPTSDEQATARSTSQRPVTSESAINPPSLRRDNPVESSSASSPASALSSAAARAGMGRTSRLKLLEKYTAHYQAGLANYDEAHQILDPSTNKYIGEIGMGVSTKNALLQNDPDQVIALEVWLFDKADERNIGNQTRILLSEYAVDHNLEQAFLKERQDDPRPFTAQLGVRFQLEGHNLRLDCEIIEALYTKSGPTKGVFQSVKVEMTVLQKT
jgi:hypothetical protein